MNFNDKVERRVHIRPSDGLKDWDYGLRFHFENEWGRTLVKTEWADFADIYWRDDTRKAEVSIKIVAWMEFDNISPSGKPVKEYYGSTNGIIEAFKWLAENTH